MSKITINIIQVKLRAIYNLILETQIKVGDMGVLWLASKKLEELLQEIKKTIETYPPEDKVGKELSTEDKSLEETIPRTKAWVVMEAAKVAFTCNGKFHVMVDGKHLAEGKYLGKKRGEETTWFNWLSNRHQEEING